MSIPLLDLRGQNLALENELKSAFERVLHDGQFILGKEVAALECALAAFTGAKHAIGVSSGTDAILLALMASGIGPGDEVLCPTFTFFATAGCVVRVGAKPIFVDADPLTFNLDVADAETRITTRTKAIIPVHLFGQAADMDSVMKLAGKYNLLVIEDAAQSLGATHRGRQLGTIGDLGTFSFFPSKNLSGFGDCGLLVTGDDALAERARLLRTHGAKPKYYHTFVGGNFRLDALQAALLSVKLPHYATYTQLRRRNAEYYTSQLRRIPHIVLSNETKLVDAAHVILPTEREDGYHIWNQYVLRIQGVGQRDILRKLFDERAIGTEIYYPVPMHVQECFKSFAYQPEDLPVSIRLASEVLAVPIYPELTPTQLEQVIQVINTFVSSLL